jgi:NAD(P)-dependent dehydrogenase (short-subunit alcohol dehydrogenase family)
VNNAGIFFTKPFTDYTAEDLKRLVSTNLEGFIYITQLAIKQMLAQKSGGSIVSITAALADNPIAGVNASIPMIIKGGLNTITRSLAIEYAKDGIRVNAVAPGVVDTPLHGNNPKDFLKTLSPMGSISTVQEIVDAVIYLTEAPHVSGEVLHVDGGAHTGKW